METKFYRRRKEISVKYHLGLSQLLTPAQSRFLLHMIDIEQMKECGLKTDFTRTEYMQRMGLKEYSFDTVARSLVELGIVERSADSSRNRVHYELSEKLYERLVTIVSCRNIGKLRAFLDFNIKKLGRSIESITDEELDELGP